MPPRHTGLLLPGPGAPRLGRTRPCLTRGTVQRMRRLSSRAHVCISRYGKDGAMHMPRFILLAFIAVVVGGAFLATALLTSSSEPQLGEIVVVTPAGTPPPTTPPPTPAPTPAPTPSPSKTAPPSATATPSPSATPSPPPEGAVPVPGCAPLAGDDDCDDDWDGDDWDDDADD